MALEHNSLMLSAVKREANFIPAKIWRKKHQKFTWNRARVRLEPSTKYTKNTERSAVWCFQTYTNLLLPRHSATNTKILHRTEYACV
jgi:hypothetical protein